MLHFPEDLSLLCCPVCSGHLGINGKGTELKCTKCEKTYPIVKNIPFFCSVKEDITPSASLSDAGDESSWTKWRMQNFEFCRDALKDLADKGLAVDMGTGRGYYQRLFENFEKCLTIDFYPYPRVDIVADITQKIPLSGGRAHVILLSNVLEHTPEPQLLLNECHRILKPGEGRLIILVPFFIKIHQAPYDFYRYTTHALEYLLNKAGFQKYSIAPLGDLLDIYELVQKSINKNFSKKIKSRRIRLEAKIIYKIHVLLAARLRKYAKHLAPRTDYVQGYGCIAFK